MKSFIFVLAATLISAHALADEAAKPDCVQPVIPIPMASDLILKNFEKKKTAYNSCIAKFVEAQREIAKSDPDPVKANMAHDAAEAAIVEQNKFIDELNARNARTGSDDSE